MRERSEKLIIKHGDELTKQARVESKVILAIREMYKHGFPKDTIIHISQEEDEVYDGETTVYVTIKQII